MRAIPQLIASTILLGGIYALIAVGLTLIFGVMRVVNFAHGEFLMLGMYLAFWAFTLLNADPYLTFVLSLPLLFGVGWLTYRIVMRPVIHASHNVHVFTTVGLSIALQNVALVLWTADSRFVRTSYYSFVVRVGGAAFNVAQLVACVVAAGVLLAPVYPVYPTAGLQFVLIAYVAVVLGGLGDMAGALIASLVVAAVEVTGSYVIGTAWKEVLYLLLFIAILTIRPAGLFGQRGAELIGT